MAPFSTRFALIGTAGFLLTLLGQQAPPVPPPGAIRGGLPPVQQIDPPEPKPGEGVDLSIRAIDAITGRGLGDVKIEVLHNGTLSDRRRWVYTKSTDALGTVTISDMVADSYTITPALTGYVLGKSSPIATVTLAAGKKPAPVLFRMWKASSVDGVVQERDGNPVAKATVDILEEQWVGGLRTLVVSQPPVLTDGAGKFAFPAVLPGTYYLRATPSRAEVQQQLRDSPAGKQAAFVDTMYPGVMYVEQAAPVKLDPGGNLYNMRIEMQKSPYYAFSGRVSGIPAEIRGSGLVLIRRAAFDSPFPFTWANPYAGNLSVQLAADGSFRAPSVPPGPYWAGYTPAGAVRGGTQFLMTDRDLEDVRIEVSPGIDLTGRLAFEDGSASDIRFGSMSVFLENMGVYVRGFSVAPNGEFRVSGLPAGPYRVEFTGPVVVRKVEVNRRSFDGGAFELSPLDPQAVITLGRTGGAIQGTVDLHDQAKEYARGMITVAPLPLHPTDTPKRKYLDGNPSFTLDHLEAGRYRVCAWLEEGSEVDTVLGNPRYEQKFAVSCQAISLSANERRAVTLTQVSVADFK